MLINTKLAAILLSLSLLSACGFSLRGSSNAELPLELQTLQVLSQGGNNELMRALQRSLKSSNITVIDDSQAGIYRLTIGTEQVSERVISVNSTARAGEYELSMSLSFQLDSDAESVLGPEILSIERVYLADPNNAVAKSDEGQLIRKEMRQALVRQILTRLQALSFE